MGRKITRRKKGPVQAKKIKYDGINFASGLERHMYMALQKAKIKAEYEGKTYTLLDGFDFTSECYERQSNGKGDFTNRGNKRILPIRYTPDFIADDFIIECKGRANESFPMRWKLFKKHVQENMPNITLYKPQNQNECDQVIQHILAKRNK
jgi:hypothetical protein